MQLGIELDSLRRTHVGRGLGLAAQDFLMFNGGGKPPPYRDNHTLPLTISHNVLK